MLWKLYIITFKRPWISFTIVIMILSCSEWIHLKRLNVTPFHKYFLCPDMNLKMRMFVLSHNFWWCCGFVKPFTLLTLHHDLLCRHSAFQNWWVQEIQAQCLQIKVNRLKNHGLIVQRRNNTAFIHSQYG